MMKCCNNCRFFWVVIRPATGEKKEQCTKHDEHFKARASGVCPMFQPWTNKLKEV